MEYKVAPSGMLIEQDNYDWSFMRVFVDFVATASPEIREEIYRELAMAIRREDDPCRTTQEHVDWNHMVDLGDKHGGWGRNYLYVWLNDDGMPFYVGQCTNTVRPGTYKYQSRSRDFQEVVKRGGCRAVVIAKHIPKSKIDDLESELISWFCWNEYPLVNVRCVPSKKEIALAKRISNHSNVALETVFLEQTEYKDEMRAIFSALGKVIGVTEIAVCA